MTLVVAIGGVRSGKSAWAEHQAAELAGGDGVTVLATADPTDASMGDRIERHQARRPATWSVIEIAGRDELVSALPQGGVGLLDGLGGWVAGLLNRAGAFVDNPDAARSATRRGSALAHSTIQAVIDTVALPGRSLVVASEETGLGVVPMGAGTAAWVDLVGELNQRLVRAADLAVVVVAGRALPLTDAAVPLSRPTQGPSLTVITSKDRPTLVAPDDRDRRAHPRLIGAGSVRALGESVAAGATAALGSTPPAPSPVAARPSAVPTAASQAAAQARIQATDESIVDVAALRRHGDRMVRPGDADHAVSVVAGGPPAWLTAAFAEALTHDLTRYPDPVEAEATLAGLYGRGPGEVVATNGAAQALWLLPAALRPRRAAVIHPLFTEAEAALRAHGVPTTRVFRDPHADFALDPAQVPDDVDLVILGNPAAASGTLAAKSMILALRQPGRIIVIDEAFMDLVPGESESLVREHAEDVVVVRSFTKSLSVPGVRAGAAITSTALAARLREVQPPWSVNAFALAGLVALGRHAGELASRAARSTAERHDLAAGLATVAGVRLWASSTNHVLIEVEHGARVAADLRARRIAVRPCGTFPGLSDDHLRITARSSAANDALVTALREVIAGAGAGAAS